MSDAFTEEQIQALSEAASMPLFAAGVARITEAFPGSGRHRGVAALRALRAGEAVDLGNGEFLTRDTTAVRPGGHG